MARQATDMLLGALVVVGIVCVAGDACAEVSDKTGSWGAIGADFAIRLGLSALSFCLSKKYPKLGIGIVAVGGFEFLVAWTDWVDIQDAVIRERGRSFFWSRYVAVSLLPISALLGLVDKRMGKRPPPPAREVLFSKITS